MLCNLNYLLVISKSLNCYQNCGMGKQTFEFKEFKYTYNYRLFGVRLIFA